MKVREQTVVRYLVTVVALALLVGHLVFPDKKIDTLTLGFLVVALVPWLSSIFESFELPGGWKVKYRDLKQAGEVVLAASAEKLLKGETPLEGPSPISDIDDPRLRLVALRLEIEKRLRELGHRHGIKKRPLSALLSALADAGVLEKPLYNSLALIIQAANRAAHGAPVSDVVGTWAAKVSPTVLGYLDAMTLDKLNYAHVRVTPAPVFIDKAGVRQEVAPDGAVGVCQVRLAPNMPDIVTLVVPLDGSYTIEIPRRRVQVVPLDETDHGYQLRAELRLLGLRVVVNPHQAREGSYIWTEPA